MNTHKMRINVLTNKLRADINEWYQFSVMYHTNANALKLAISHVFPNATATEQREIKKEFKGEL